MANTENKTKPTDEKVDAFLDAVAHKKRKEDSFTILKLMHEITGETARMWGPSIVGFGKYHYIYKTGREGDMFGTGFSPRKTALTLYIIAGFKLYDELMAKLGQYKTGKSCLYIKKLEDVDMKVLTELIRESYKYIINKNWP